MGPNHQPHVQFPTTPKLPPSIQAAKWPPDDNDLPGDPGVPSFGGGGGGYGGGDDGNFKKGRFKVWAVLVGILAVAGVGAAVVFGGMKDSEKLDPKKAAQMKKEVALLPIGEALPKYREWAAQEDETKLRASSTGRFSALIDDARKQWVEVSGRDRADLGPAHARRQALDAVDRYGSRKRRQPVQETRQPSPPSSVSLGL